MSWSRQSTISDRMGLVSMGSGAGIRGVLGGAGVMTILCMSSLSKSKLKLEEK